MNSARSSSEPISSLDPLDRAAIAYLCFPLLIFLATWFRWWAALPLAACAAYSLWPALVPQQPGSRTAPRVTRLQLTVAIVVGVAWAVLGGTDHLVFANADWHVRDAVLHDLVVSQWPVGYGPHDGQDTMLRTSIAFFLPAALVGKALGLAAAHASLALWTAIGATLFLTQMLSLTRSSIGAVLLVAAIVVLFSGMDIVGELLNGGPRFRQDWNITMHLEWWAGSYQYSSMTTQLFWVPNHALGGWMMMGLLARHAQSAPLDRMLPVLLAAAALWSPLTALGLLPFVAYRAALVVRRTGAWTFLQPRVSVPALAVGVAIAAYLALDVGGVRRGAPVVAASDTTMSVLRQVQFFLLEAGLLGIAIMSVRRSTEMVLALIILLLLPCLSFGPGNDLVMRASIPSLVVLMIAACRLLLETTADRRVSRAKIMVGAVLIVGAATPVAEIARAVLLPAWPVNMQATLIGANCGQYPPHYVAGLGDQMVARLLRRPSALALGPQGRAQCDNPGLDLMWAFLSPPRHTLR